MKPGASCMTHSQNVSHVNENPNHIGNKISTQTTAKVRSFSRFSLMISLFHFEFIPDGNNVNNEMYFKIFHHLRNAVRRKHLEKWV